MPTISLNPLDYSILGLYVVFVVGIGLALKMKSSSEFLTSAHSIPTWVTGLAFISANLGALELVGMAASGAKYGIATCHFYWLGAIPAMIFLAVFMMPFYYGSKARSVPEYLNLRFDGRVRCLNSISFAVMTVFASGISMNALAKLLNELLGWNYHLALWVCSVVVLIYVLKGGLTSAIYTEVLQFFMIVLGFTPVVYLGLKDAGGWSRVMEILHGVGRNPAALHLKEAGVTYDASAWTSAWTPVIAGPAHNPMGVDLFAMVFGLGFVLSFGYWCTNFLVVQRAMAAKNMNAARNTPLVAAVPKMLFPALVILPGMIAVALMATPGKGYRIPPPPMDHKALAAAVAEVKEAAKEGPAQGAASIAAKPKNKLDPGKIAAVIKEYGDQPIGKGLEPNATPEDRALLSRFAASYQEAGTEYDYDGVILSLVRKYCPPGLLGLALTALLASFMSGMAGNVTAFNTVWTYDLYQAYLAPGKSDGHYLWMGRCITIAGILLSIACAYFARMYNNAMDVIQLVFSFVNAPLFATFLLGMFWKRATGTGAFLGLAGGICCSALIHGLTVAEGKGGWIHPLHQFPSTMAQNFYLASFAFIVCFLLTFVISVLTRRSKSDEQLKGLVYSLTPRLVDESLAWYAKPGFIGVVLLGCCAILNLIFW